jgi:hypothetical protein
MLLQLVITHSANLYVLIESVLIFLWLIFFFLILFQLKVCPKYLCLSTVGFRNDLFQRDTNKVFITDFFGSQKRIEMAADPIVVPSPSNKETRLNFLSLLNYHEIKTYVTIAITVCRIRRKCQNVLYTMQTPFRHYAFTV